MNPQVICLYLKVLIMAGVLLIAIDNAAQSAQLKDKEYKNEKLNILLFTADDLDRNSLGCYGSAVPDISPNIDRFAAQSLNFKQAYVNSAICVPSRAVIATGLYSHHNDVNGFFKIKKDHESSIPTIMELFKEKEYATGILGKVSHSTPKESFKWDYEFDRDDLGSGRSPSKYYQRTKAFLDKCKRDNKPFYFMVNSHDPHRPFFNPSLPLQNGEEKPSRIYSSEEITVPGFVSDLPEVRKELSYYFNSTRRLDDTFGKVMQALDESGLADNTIVIFISDNGIAIPFAKANTYYASNRTPFLIRWPKVIPAGKVNTDDYISMVDLMPTLLDATGISISQELDGTSFFPLLKGKRQPQRDRVFSEIDYKSAGGATPMRGVQTKKFLYIYNAWSDGERYYANANEGETLKAMELAAMSNKEIASRVKMHHYRQPEEFYDIQKDPDCLHNLIGMPDYAPQKRELRDLLQRWMQSTHDPLLKVFLERNNEKVKSKLFYECYPESKQRDKNKLNYSKGFITKP